MISKSPLQQTLRKIGRAPNLLWGNHISCFQGPLDENLPCQDGCKLSLFDLGVNNKSKIIQLLTFRFWLFPLLIYSRLTVNQAPQLQIVLVLTWLSQKNVMASNGISDTLRHFGLFALKGWLTCLSTSLDLILTTSEQNWIMGKIETIKQ